MSPLAPRLKAQIHTAAFYCAMFGALGAHLPFWPVWMEDWGLTPGEVGLFMGLGFVTRVIAGLAVPVLADRAGARRQVLMVLCLAGAVVFGAHALIGARWLVLLGTLVTGAILSGMIPLGEALGSGAAQRHGFAYAVPRAVGSVAFLLANLVVGALIGAYGANMALWWIVALLLVAAVLAPGHPGAGIRGSDGAPPGFAEIGRMLTHPTFALFTAAAAMSLASHGVYYLYGSIHWRSLGLGEALIGRLWAFSVGVEVIVMLLLGERLIRRLGPVGALTLSGLGGIGRWGMMALDPLGPGLWALQATHTLTFVAGHLGAIAFIAQAVPGRFAATAQGAFMGFGSGIFMALTMMLGAVVYPLAGGLTYLLAAAMSATGLALSLLLARRWSGDKLAL